MALAASYGGSPLSQILIRRSTALLPKSIQTWPLRNLISASFAIPAITTNIPGLIADIWEGILRAVPKKKTSHMKKRHRQLAGKALKDVKAVNQCPGCGRPKKAHTLCPYCVAEIYESWKHRDAEASEAAKASEGTKS